MGHVDAVYVFQSLITEDAGYATEHEKRYLRETADIDVSTCHSIPELAGKIATVLRSNLIWPGLCRLTIVRRLGRSNHLQVEGFWVASRADEAVMNLDYSCFVDAPSGSLNALKNGSLRTYSDLREVVEKFDLKRQPLQRSLYKLAQMGVVSGLCLPIGFGSEEPRGYLFLNSRDSGAFNDLNQSQMLLLFYLGQFTAEGLERLEDRANTSSLSELNALSHRKSEVFDLKLLQRLCSEQWGVELKLQGALPDEFHQQLVIHGHWSYFFAKVAMGASVKSVKFIVSKGSTGKFRVEILVGNDSNTRDLVRLLGVREVISLTDQSMVFELSRDLAVGEYRYSVEAQ